MLTTCVAALYVDALGVYPTLEGVDAWDCSRDAREYLGPWPVVAHPPCSPWSRMRHLARARRSRDCGLCAVEQVRAYGGVLEQPAHSKLFQYCALPLPRSTTLSTDGFSVEVEQVAWGHCARKRTWLYFVGVDPKLVCQTLRTGGTPTHWQSGAHNASRPPPRGTKVCSVAQRNRTPIDFAQWLVMLARGVL